MAISKRKNVTNREQDILEQAEYNGSISVHTGDKVTRFVRPAGGGSERTANDGAASNTKRNGVIYSHDDGYGRFDSDLVGRAGKK